jgi:hypothetical protein
MKAEIPMPRFSNSRASKRWACLAVLTTCIAVCVIQVVYSAAERKVSTAVSTANPIQPQPVDSIRQLPLATKDLIVDKNTHLVYASVPGNVLTRGNTLTQIDPVAGTIGSSVFVGSEPNKLAISDNNQFIYVGLDGDGGVRRFDVATQSAQLHFQLGMSAFNGPMFVSDMEVLPGAPESVAISRRVAGVSPDHAGVAIFDNGVQRPSVSNVNVGTANRIEFSNSASLLYGANTQDTGLQLWRLSVTQSGVSFANQITGVQSEFGDIEFEGGLLYHTIGRVFDPEAGTTVGTYSGMSFQFFIGPTSVVVDSTNNRVYFLGGGGVDPGSSGTAKVYAFNKSTFALIDSFNIPTIGRVGSLVQWGATGLAFRDDTSVYLIPTPGSGPPPPTPTPTPTPTPLPTPAAGELRQIALPTKDLVLVPGTQTIYASVPSSGGAQSNSLTAIDPVLGSIGTSVPVGSEPNRLAVTDNALQIYVGLDGESAIRRFDVATQAAGLKFSIGQNAVDIASMPGNPNTIAVVRNRASQELLIYDDSVPRPVTKFSNVTTVAFSNSPEVLYGYDQFTTAQTFSKMTVGSCGVAVARETSRILTGNDIYNVKYDNGRVYSGAGRVIDPEAETLVGTFFVPTTFVPLLGSVLVETDSKAKRIYSLFTDSASVTLRVYDMDTFAIVGALNLPGVTGTPIRLIRWGANGLAFNTPTNVYLLQNSLIAPPSGSFVPAPLATTGTFTISGTVNELITPVPNVTITFSGLQSGTVQTDASGKYSIGNLPLCGTLTITPSKPNYTFTPASITLTNPRTQFVNFSAFHRTIGFVSSQVTVNESASKVFLAISRSAGLPPTTTDIDYSTSNGTASDRSDYTAAIGTFHFDTITSQAPLEVLLTDDAFVEGPETFTVTLQPVPGFDLVNPTVTVTIQDNDSDPMAPNPIDGPSLFVRQHYHDFLNRDPDNSGFAFWQNEITKCGADAQCVEVKRINVSAAFFLSIEYKETGYFAYRAYKAAYGDAMSPNVAVTVPMIRLDEFLRDSKQIGNGVIVGQPDWETRLNTNKDAYVLAFVQRQRFIAAYPLSMSATDFVTTLDQNAGSVLSENEKSQLITLLGSTPGDPAKRASVLRLVVEDPDLLLKEFNRAFVLSQYFGYLRRNPDDAPDADFRGWEFWLKKLNDFQGDFVRAEMVKAFIGSVEYRLRFGPQPAQAIKQESRLQ